MPSVDTYRSRAISPRAADDGVVVIHCSDPRYQAHFQEFLRERLHLDHYALVAIPGGVQTLTLVEYLPKFAWSGWRWMKFLDTLMQPRRFVLIAHDDCRWYIENRFVTDPKNARGRQIEDLHRIGAELRTRFGALDVEPFYATLVEGHAEFEKV